MRARILIVEDEERGVALLRRFLEPLGYEVRATQDPSKVKSMVVDGDVDLVLLDLMLAGSDGLDVLRALRDFSSVPVIVVTARDALTDKVETLGLGADDYVVKPYASDELLARIKAVLRRGSHEVTKMQPIAVGPIVIELDTPRVLVEGVEVDLSKNEYQVLTVLAQNRGRVVVADTLLDKVWGSEYRGYVSTLHVTVSRLRKKLGHCGKEYIVTKSGIGYMMKSDV
ncbi:two-component system, OmpR family, response regulator VicR [Ferrithrix thermotolerans DSM 19514]|uniref:Two-component system, OmpR family, response regulator VicR n=1 Tax=Ferrithrix thermotolerans DSM 19514 TaxID=1121881 RepID=A0A1M4V362_9ACTN|nr:response regulator transcription factor [Ferrithrix thermotolerans]SHE63327.1 two-component system, OmpR family, response regulator VicR [Ferrithrix thermotolerans DSM 19514]